MRTKTKVMAAVLAATIVSGFVLHVRGGNGLTALHLICMGTFTVMATHHVLSHSGKRRKGFGQPQQTAYITLEPHRCQACWECVDACPKEVLGKKKKTDVIELTNQGQTLLDISSLQMFTGGLTVSLGKSKLAPGQSTKLKVTAMRDELLKLRRRPRILMITNDPDQGKVVININAK